MQLSPCSVSWKSTDVRVLSLTSHDQRKSQIKVTLNVLALEAIDSALYKIQHMEGVPSDRQRPILPGRHSSDNVYVVRDVLNKA